MRIKLPFNPTYSGKMIMGCKKNIYISNLLANGYLAAI